MRLTNARLSTAIGTALSKNAILLSCTGAKSGVERDVALLCTPSGDDIVLVASRTGHANNPGWYYNLKAHPECVVRFRNKYAKRLRCSSSLLLSKRPSPLASRLYSSRAVASPLSCTCSAEIHYTF